MKICIAIDRPISMALKQSFFDMLTDCDASLEKPDGADLVIVESKQRLQELYNENQSFAVFSLQEAKNLPANARWIPVVDFIPPLSAFMLEVTEGIAKRKEYPRPVKKHSVLEIGVEYRLCSPALDTLRILVVDDKQENLSLALNQLGNKHFVTLANGYAYALQLMRTNTYDVVLSDCQMLPETKNTALSLEGIVIGQPVHNGLFLIFHATRRGAKVAIVTDANHHMDWVSALFDDSDLREPQNVNGQPVLLINYLGKQWDEALAKLILL